MREGGMKEGCKDTLVVLLHSDAMLAMHARAYITHTQTRGVCKLHKKKGVAIREQLINAAVLGPGG